MTPTDYEFQLKLTHAQAMLLLEDPRAWACTHAHELEALVLPADEAQAIHDAQEAERERKFAPFKLAAQSAKDHRDKIILDFLSKGES